MSGTIIAILIGVGVGAATLIVTTRVFPDGPKHLIARRREFSVCMGPSEALSAVKTELEGLGYRAFRVDPEQSALMARHSTTLRSWARDVHVHVRAVSEGTSVVCVTTWPRPKNVLVDLGEGKAVLRRLEQQLGQAGH